MGRRFFLGMPIASPAGFCASAPRRFNAYAPSLPYLLLVRQRINRMNAPQGIGLTKVVPLSGDNAFSYKPLVVFSYTKKEPVSIELPAGFWQNVSSRSWRR